MGTAMALEVVKALSNTAKHGCRLIGKTEESKHQVKKEWADDLLRTFGFEHRVLGAPPTEGSCILVGNHIGFLDILLVMASLPESVFIAKDDLRRWPIIGAGAALAGTIFVNRDPGQDRSSVRSQVMASLRSGIRKVVVFPAGTTRLYEELPWKKGIFEIAREARVPVKLFRVNYEPLRQCAYVDDDNLLKQIKGLTRLKKKRATLQWLSETPLVEDPLALAKSLREELLASASAGDSLASGE